MKSLIHLFFLFITGIVFSQDFETRFYVINDESLPIVSVVEESMFFRKNSKITFKGDLRINANNYWQAVDMNAAINKQESYLNRKNTVQKEITSESLGLYRPKKNNDSGVQVRFQPGIYNTQRNRTKNSVYIDMSQPIYYSNLGRRGYNSYFY
ncbi:MAG TPA: hypothetical protein VFD80_01885 [Flavobacteriaceae bacterium]|nr:hypothetical protein [Flavobacteriaceae bacterium]